MWTYHPELLEKAVPRYTSYPTAAEFHEGVGAAEMSAALAMVAPEDDLSLYVHIPYCRQICWYCGCNTGAANRRHRLDSYLDALGRELGLVAGRLGGRGRVTRIAFGGGSPNAIAAVDFVRLVDRLTTQFRADGATLSVELDPRDLDAAWIEAMGKAGVRRASLGVQTLAPHVQAAIGRVQPAATIAAAVAGLRAAGVDSINFDLMYGLPGQSEDDLRETLAQAVAMRPARIALFGYAHVPNLIPRQRRIETARLPDSRARFAQAALGYALLVAAGYRAVGFDHFALPGDALAIAAAEGRLHRNFQGFTEDNSAILLGFGASAISAFPDRLLQNEKNAGRYRMLLSGGRLPAARGTYRTAEDRRRGRMIEEILCRGEADVAGLPLCEVLSAIRPFQDHDLVRLTGARLKLEPEALPYARAIAAIFDAHRHDGGARFSNAI